MNLQRCLLLLGFFVLNTVAIPLERDLIKRQTDFDIQSDVTYIYNNYIDADSPTIKSDFTQQVVARLYANYPSWNVVIYHVAHNDDDPKLCYSGTVYGTEFELPLPGTVSQTYGYDIVLLENGNLNMNGNPGGFDNWAFNGPSFTSYSDEGLVIFGNNC